MSAMTLHGPSFTWRLLKLLDPKTSVPPPSLQSRFKYQTRKSFDRLVESFRGLKCPHLILRGGFCYVFVGRLFLYRGREGFSSMRLAYFDCCLFHPAVETAFILGVMSCRRPCRRVFWVSWISFRLSFGRGWGGRRRSYWNEGRFSFSGYNLTM